MRVVVHIAIDDLSSFIRGDEVLLARAGKKDVVDVCIDDPEMLRYELKGEGGDVWISIGPHR